MKHILPFLTFLLITIKVAAQTPTVTITGNTVYVEPMQEYSYTATLSSVPANSHSWVATWTISGTDQTVNYDNQVPAPSMQRYNARIKWKNTHNASDPKSIKVKVTYKITKDNETTDHTIESTVYGVTVRYLGNVISMTVAGTTLLANQSRQLPCGTQAITVSVPTPDTDPVVAVVYTWTYPAGWTGPAQSNSNSVTVTPNAPGQGAIKVEARRSDGIIKTGIITNVTRPLPSITSTSPSGPLQFCTPGQTITASAVGSQADKFLWTPTGGALINGSSSPVTVAGNVTVTSPTDGGYTVRAYSTACAVASTNVLSKETWFGPAYQQYATYTTNGLVYGLVESDDDSYPNAFCWTGNPTIGPVSMVFQRLFTNTWTKMYSTPSNLIWEYNQNNAIHLTFKAIGQQGLFRQTFGNNCGTQEKWYGFKVISCLQGLTVFPNPSTGDKISLKLDNVDNEEVMPQQILLFSEKSSSPVREVSALDVYKKKSFKDANTIEIDTKGLPRGVYYLHVTHGKKVNKEKEKIRLVLE